MIICEFEDGGKAKLRHVTVNALIIKNGKVLLGKRGTYMGGKPMLEGGKWALIGGFVGRDESTQQALKREVKEETKLDLSNLKLLHVKDNPDRPHEDRQNIEFVYIGEINGEIDDSDEEVTELKWFSLDELPPPETVAFDHHDDLLLYKKFLQKPFDLPFFGKFKP
jgi:ADP-ribose pyrophosphatase YjhB (NUDIX family)